MKYSVAITAGGLISREFARSAGTQIKAMLIIHGKTLLERTVEAFRECGVTGRIALVAPEEIRETAGAQAVDQFISAHESGIENIRRGLSYFSEETRIVWCASDLPFISPGSIKDFLERCPEDASLCYPVFERDEINPSMRAAIPSYIRLKDGHFTGGSIFRLDVAPCMARMEEIGRCFTSRKSTIAMVQLLGLKTVVNFLMGRCSINDILKRVEEILHTRCAVVRGCDPSVTVDIDDEASYEFALKYAEKHFR